MSNLGESNFSDIMDDQAWLSRLRMSSSSSQRGTQASRIGFEYGNN